MNELFRSNDRMVRWASSPAVSGDGVHGAIPALIEKILALNTGLLAATVRRERENLEAEADALFGAGRHFLIYGSLAPGGPNHQKLAEIAGSWTRGWLNGELVASGWGASLGYPALCWNASGPRVEAWLLRSEDLPLHWDNLDAFEGPGYLRLLAPFWTADGLAAVGYYYGVAERGGGY